MENSSYSPHNTRKKLLWALGIFALFIFSSVFTHCDFAFFWSRKSHLTDIISAMFPPDTSYTGKIVMPLIATIKMSVTGTFLGAFLAGDLYILTAMHMPLAGLFMPVLVILTVLLLVFTLLRI